MISEISVAMVASLLVIFEPVISKTVKARTRKLNFLFRLAIFVAVCSFGYGALTVFSARLVAGFLRDVGDIYLSVLVLVLFIAIGIAAERKRYM